MQDNMLTSAQALGVLNMTPSTLKQHIEAGRLTKHGGGKGKQAYYPETQVNALKQMIEEERYAVAK